MATGYGIVNYYFMILFQRFRYFVKELSKKGCSLWNSPQNSAYFVKLSKIFYEVEKEINTKDNVSIIEEIQGFRRSYELHVDELEMSMNEILELLCFALRKMTEVNKNRPEKEWKIPNMTHKIKGISFRFHLSQFQMRFALRLAVVLCISRCV